MSTLKAIAFIAALACLFSVFIGKARTEEATKKTQIEALLDAIEWVESKGDANAIGDGGASVGAYQIQKIYVDDINQWGYNYSYDDRYDRNKSRDMARIYLTHYGGTIEEMARKHNGGPRGHKKHATLRYWHKVRARME